MKISYFEETIDEVLLEHINGQKHGGLHVGIYTGAGQVAQSAGVRFGVIKGPMGKWTHWGILDGMILDLPADGMAVPDPNGDEHHGDGSTGKPDDPNFDEDHVPYLKRGDKGNMVKYMQECLIHFDSKNYPLTKSHKKDGSLDGLFGSETDKAIRKLQKAHKLLVDGVCGPKTWSVILGITCH